MGRKTRTFDDILMGKPDYDDFKRVASLFHSDNLERHERNIFKHKRRKCG